MDTKGLEKFAREARVQLINQVGAKLRWVLSADNAQLRETSHAINTLQQRIKATSQQAVIEQVAYTWFNRLCALRFIDLNGYSSIRIVSPHDGGIQPELLTLAKQGEIAEIADHVDQERVLGLLIGKIKSHNAEQESYRLLLVAACNGEYSRTMPFLFAKIDDYAELLLPDDLLSTQSILWAIREALTAEACATVEVLGWLYQFYIAERKDAVIKSKTQIDSADIPAATQLFTPHWIVRYLVENSLGRLWLEKHPDSRLRETMRYYIADPAEPTTTLAEATPFQPTAITLCDPAAGSGHILVYAFDLLAAIYAEQGYSRREIPQLILTHNLVGLEIDERAAVLAAFALTMKALEWDRRWLTRGVTPRIILLSPQALSANEVDESGLAESAEGAPWRHLLAGLKEDANAWQAVGTVGSLWRPRLTVAEIAELRPKLAGEHDLVRQAIHAKINTLLDQIEPLATQYDVVVANPPYMGSKNQNDGLKKFLATHYADYKSDLFSAFMVRCLEMSVQNGQLGFVTPFVWMFISSYEKLRTHLLENAAITNLAQLEYNAFAPAMIPVCVFTLENDSKIDYKGAFIRLSDFRGSENQAPKTLEAIGDPEGCGYFYRASASDFKKIPGSPIAYWVSDKLRGTYDKGDLLSTIAVPRQGFATGENDPFLRYWPKVKLGDIGFGMQSRDIAKASNLRWFPCNKGGEFRKWYGNNYHIVNWQDDGREMRNFKGSVIRNPS